MYFNAINLKWEVHVYLLKNVEVQVKLGFCFAALKVIPFTPIFSPHPNHLPYHFYLISLPKISKALNPTPIPKIQ